MDKLLPIVPGCLCLVTRGFHAGQTTKAVKYLGEFDNFTDKDIWEIDVCVRISHTNRPGTMEPYMTESFLMRIDGHQPDEQDVTAKERGNDILARTAI